MTNQCKPALPQSVDQLGVVDQVVEAFHPRNRLATVLGFIAGGVVPAATFLEAHGELDLDRPLHSQVATYLVLGGLLFSAKTVFAWAKLAFQDGWKAAGFVVLLEGVMITSHVPILPLVLLALLVAINGVATGCILSLGRRGTLAAEPVVAAVVDAQLATAPPAPPAKRATPARKRRATRLNDFDGSSSSEEPLTHVRLKRPEPPISPQKHFAFLERPLASR
jgi:hypothetical protein